MVLGHGATPLATVVAGLAGPDVLTVCLSLGIPSHESSSTLPKHFLTAFTKLLNILANYTSDNLPSQVSVESLTYMSRKITSKPNNKNCKHHHKILPVFLKATDSSLSLQQDENINIMHQGNSFSALSPQEKISILCTKGTASQLFPHKRKYQYYAPREQLLSFSQQEQVVLITTRHFIDHVGVTN